MLTSTAIQINFEYLLFVWKVVEHLVIPHILNVAYVGSRLERSSLDLGPELMCVYVAK